MQQAFFNGRWTNKAVALRMGKRFVDKVEVHTFVLVISVRCFQTGNVAKERWSGQAPEHDHRVFSLRIGESKLAALVVKDRQVR